MPRFRPARLPGLSALRVPLHPRAVRIGRAIRGRMPRLPPIRGVISAADLLTLTNGLMGFLAIAVVTGAANLYEPPFFGLDDTFPGLQDDKFLLAAVLITVGLVCDALDGIVARRFGGSRLGADLDTLSDTITFVVAPAFMVFTYYGADERLVFQALLAAGLVLVMGMLRLARFNSNPVESSTTTFQGLPTPWCAITIALLVLAGVQATYALPIVAVLAFLMMSNAAYPKSRGKATVLALAMGAAALVTVAVILYFPEGQPRVLGTAFTLVMLAVALLPLLLARAKRRRERDGT
ncbi:MAG TPA: CDP-alcohol phosphatidyltransferase family protein [Candidatus Thermoplasmatota archaeon]|nr:CDP-alcohol phosphatidyltransferase family protein [Candidatus Thermoplasmatota archaeon]